MRFKVIGENPDTGGRMVMEIDAGSKAAAGKMASEKGMRVNRVEPVEGTAPVYQPEGDSRPVAGIHPLIKLFALLAILAVVGYIFWDWIRTRMGW